MSPPVPGAALEIRRADAQGADALALLREAAVEARALYPELHAPGAPWPTNPRWPDRGVYLVMYAAGVPVAMGALQPLDDEAAELRRMFVQSGRRRHGLARRLLQALEDEARRLGYCRMRLETGCRQQAAMRLYEASGYARIPAFGEHVGDATSVCYEKRL